MDVLLLNLAEMVGENYVEIPYEPTQTGMPPLGLLYLAQVLINNGYSVQVYDQCVTGLKNEELAKRVKQWDPKIIGFSMCLSNYWTTSDLLKRVKSGNPNAIIVAGNYIPTFYHDKLMAADDFDYCVFGEGEYIFLELVNKLLRHENKDFKDIKGIAYRENGIVKSTPRPEHIKNIDEIPIPDRKLVDFNYRLQRKSSAIITSRGCPYRCRFCYFNSIMGCKWRARSVKNIIEELKMLHDEGYKEVVLGDSSFNMSMKRTRDLAVEVRKNGLNSMEFGGDLRTDRTNDELLRLMISMNFTKALFGIESGNQRILDYYQKDTTIEKIKLAVKKANKARMDVIFGTFIVGAPDETPAEVINTLKFANKLHLSFAAFQVLSTIPISTIYQELADKKYFTPRDDDWKGWLYVSDISPKAVPRRILYKLIDEGWVQFFSNYGRMFRFVTRSVTNPTYIRYMMDMFRSARY